jgi:hypothetical protein
VTLPRPKPALLLVVAASLFLLAGDIFLYRQTRFLRAQLRGLEILAPGAQMQPLAGLSDSYAPVTVNFGRRQRPTLVLVFSPSCNVCTENWPEWEEALSATSRTTARVIAVDLGGALPDAYAKRYNLDKFRVIVHPLALGVLADNLKLTPETVLVGRDGRVEHAWLGALGARRTRELESALCARE